METKINFTTLESSPYENNNLPIINIKKIFTKKESFNKVVYNIYDGTLSLADKQKCKIMYSLADKKTGVIFASRKKIAEAFKKNNLPASKGTISNFIKKMKDLDFIHYKKPTTKEKFQEKKTIYTSLKCHLSFVTR